MQSLDSTVSRFPVRLVAFTNILYRHKIASDCPTYTAIQYLAPNKIDRSKFKNVCTRKQKIYCAFYLNSSWQTAVNCRIVNVQNVPNDKRCTRRVRQPRSLLRRAVKRRHSQHYSNTLYLLFDPKQTILKLHFITNHY